MPLTEQELRSMVRDAIARRVPRNDGEAELAVAFRAHASHGLLPLLGGSDGDGACLIEPAVRCSHCGYCLSFGH